MLLTLLLQVPDWTLFFGRFHPVLVHLPIGFLLIAALLETGRRLGKITLDDSVISFILLWSAVSATLACGAGYLLSLGGGYEQELLDAHMWQGIGVAVLAWVAWLAKSGLLARHFTRAAVFYLPALALGTLLTLTAGHHGGGLTHGEGYLTQYTPEPFRALAGLPPRQEEIKEIKPIANVPEAVVYRDIVRPILSVHCTQCHNAAKQKGDLRLDTYELVMKGGENGPVLVAGKSPDSELLKRCLLPLEDDNHMPPKGKRQLSESQIALLAWWIDQGAPSDKKVADLKTNDQIQPALAALSTPGGEQEVGGSQSAVLSMNVAEPDPKAMEALRKAQLLVMPVARQQNLMEVSAINAPSFSDQQIALLKPLAPQLVWLKLSDTHITDASMREIAQLKNLNKLHLEGTAVSDAGLQQLTNLPYLEYLNLVGTKVTDTGLQQLARLKSLKNVYVWNTAVTDSGMAQLRRTRPDLQIVSGLSERAVAEFLKAGQTAQQESKP